VAGDLPMNSKCYRKFNSSSLSWYSASNDCLSRGGSLAVFTDIGRPSDNSQLTNWLYNSSRPIYWIGLVKPWWKTTDKGDDLLSCSYNNKMLPRWPIPKAFRDRQGSINR